IEEERRGLSLSAAGIDIRANEDGTERFFGHAAVFNTRTAIGNPLKWGFLEEIAPGAFTKTIHEGDARMLIDHDSYYVVSRVSAGTLRLAQDVQGLAVDSDLDTNLSYVRDLKANLRNGNITGMSFGFFVVKDDWATEEIETNDGQRAEVEVRRILETKLLEVSAVTFPAYEETDAGIRSVRSALRRRGDRDAIARRAEFKPELATLLDELPAESKRTVIPVSGLEKKAADETPETSTQDEPGETTRAEEEIAQTDDVSEPAASTRTAPLECEMAKTRLRELQARLRKA